MNSIEKPAVDYSLIIPVFNEEVNINPLVNRIEKVLSGISFTYEIIIVNNGSFDSTPLVLENLLKTCPRLVVLTLTRNFGYEGAIIAGMENAKGKKIIIMDGDQQAQRTRWARDDAKSFQSLYPNLRRVLILYMEFVPSALKDG